MCIRDRAREVIRYIQSARKTANLNVDDRIQLVLITGDLELKNAIIEYHEIIANETLATELSYESEKDFKMDVRIDEIDLTIYIEKT